MPKPDSITDPLLVPLAPVVFWLWLALGFGAGAVLDDALGLPLALGLLLEEGEADELAEPLGRALGD